MLIGLSLLEACGPSAPSPDTCNSPSSDGVDSLEVRGSAGTAGSSPQYLTGPQGSPMVIYSIAVGGAQPPWCLQQSTEILDGTTAVAHDSVPLRTYGDGTDSVTMAHYVIVNPSGAATLTVRVTVGSHTSQIETGHFSPPDLSAAAPLDMTRDTQPD